MKHRISQIQPDCMILKAPKREMKTRVLLNGKLRGKKVVFSFRILVPLKSSNRAGSDLYDASYH
jgi:hypothetical protein